VGDAAGLLLLDSVEHVPAAAADVAELIGRCPGLRLLSTAREPWARPAGRIWPLAPLAVPDPNRRATADDVAANPAVALLLDRVRAVRPHFTLTQENVGPVVNLCRRLDGLPLAIELAAGHLRDRDVVEVEAELAARSMTLRADVVDLPGRHRTLRATVEWSTARLSELDRERLAVLGAFRGTIAWATLTAVLESATMTTTDLDRSLDRLARASLVTWDPAGGRVDLLDTIRETAAELLADSGSAARVRAAHAHHLLDLVRAGDHEAIDGQVDDVRAALGYAIADGRHLLDLELVRQLGDYLSARGRFAEAHRLLAAIAETATAETATGEATGGASEAADVRATATLRAGVAANQHGDHHAARRLGERLLATDTVPDRRVAGLNLMGAAHKSLGDLDRATAYYLDCLALAEELGNNRYVTVALNNLGTVAHDRGDYAEAERCYRRSMEIKQATGDAVGTAIALVNLGSLDKDRAEAGPAEGYLVEAVRALRELNFSYGLAFALALLAEVRLARGDAADAARLAGESAAIGEVLEQPAVRAMAGQALGDIDRLAGDLAGAEAHYLASLAEGPEPAERMRLLDRLAAAVLTRDRAAAARWAAEAETIRSTMGYPVPPADRPMVAATRAGLTD
jgi:predicted ATPase